MKSLRSGENLLGFASAAILTASVLLVQTPPIPEAEVLEPVVPTVPRIQPISVFPDFSSMPVVEIRKRWFLDYIEMYVDAENQRVAGQRELLLGFANVVAQGFTLSRTERRQLRALAEVYQVPTDEASERELVVELLKRVDTIPVSLALAQAANESAWGTSRFALEANNIFGQWCYEAGCGLVPTRRHASATHEVRSFESVEHAVQAYFLNLNTHPGYEDFRQMRLQMRTQTGNLDPLVLAYGLMVYSQRGQHYVDEVQTIIQQNGLRQRDKS